MELDLATIVLSWLSLAIVVGFFSCWFVAIRRMVLGQTLIAWEPRRSVPWGLFDVIAAVLLVILLAIVAQVFVKQTGLVPHFDLEQLTNQQKALLLVADGLSRLAVMPLLVLIVKLRTGVTWRDFGWSADKLLDDIRLGVACFVMVVPVVWLIQSIMVRFQPYEHELLDVLKNRTDIVTVLAMFFVAAIVAPVTEEFLFRVVLQGWLEKVVCFRGPTHELVLGAAQDQPMGEAPIQAELADAPPPHGTVDSFHDHGDAQAIFLSDSEKPAGFPDNPYQPPQVPSPPMKQRIPEIPGLAPLEFDLQQAEFIERRLRRWGWAPILISSLVFALMHLGQGPAWVALTVLAIAMGVLYQRTHRIMPSLVVHFLLNGLTLVAVLIAPDQA